MNNDLLGLRFLKVSEHQEEDGVYYIKAKSILLPTVCPVCSHAHLHRHGASQQVYFDCPIHGNKTVIEVTRKRFRCKSCGKTFFEPLPEIDAKRQVTTRLEQYINKRCFKYSFLSIAQEIGLDEKTVRNIFHDHIIKIESDIKFEAPVFMGIDEIKVVGKPRAVITNVQKNCLYDMLPSRRKDSLVEYFSNMKNSDRVKLVAIDMWRPYRDVVERCMPNAVIVIDKFHVVRMANDAIEKVRKSIRKEVSTRQRLKLKNDRFTLLKRNASLSEFEIDKLQEWTVAFPSLGEAYQLKEDFFNIWNANSRLEAEGLYDEWAGNISDNVLWAFEDVLRAMNNWRPYIFNYFDHPITNAYTESFNNLIRSMNRMGRGYSFEVLRARLLYNEEARKNTRSSIRKQIKKPSQKLENDTWNFSLTEKSLFKKNSQPMAKKRFVEYGAHIPTLVKLLDSGKFL